MLFKLLKRDFISTGRILGIVYIIAAAISAILIVSSFINNSKSQDLNLVESLGILVLALISLCLFVLTTVVIFVDFHKSLYGEQGYLTFTLPVKGWQILASKTIVSVSWYLISLGAIVGSWWVIATTFKNRLGNDYLTIKDLISEILSINLDAVAFSIIASLVQYFIIFTFVTLVVFFTNTLSNTRLFQKRGILWTIVLFIPIFATIIKFATFIKSKFVCALFYVDDEIRFVTQNAEYQILTRNRNIPIDFADVFVYLAFGIAIFFATHYIMNKKVNIR